MAIVPPAGSQSTRRRPELPGRFPGIQENPIMTAETPSAAVPARPAVSLDGTAPSPWQRRPGEHAASGSRARARTGADPAVIDPVTRARAGGTQAQASQPAPRAPLPQIAGISIAARYRSATPGAWAGGDLYEIIPTAHGIRVIIGDVRGQGLDAALLARQVLSAFQQSAAAVPALEHVAGEVSRAIRPHLGEEDFVTAALAQIAPGGTLTVVNCGHHPPLLHRGGVLRPLAGQTAALPLGLDDDFTAFTTCWRPGDRLLLYTDGLVESRNRHGDFFPQDQIATALLAAGCDQALDGLLAAVHRHAGGHGHDDIALLLLEHGADPRTEAPTDTPDTER
jgi:phosphoserine phosphatase RsbU/P